MEFTKQKTYKPAPTTYNFRQLADILDLGVKRNRLMEIMRKAGILDCNGFPFEKYVKAGYFNYRAKRVCNREYPASSVVGKEGLNFVKSMINEYLTKTENNDN